MPRTMVDERDGAGEVSPAAPARPQPLDLAVIYRDHAALVARWAARLLGPAGDVDDVLHEVFLVAHRRLGSFRGDAAITTWLYAITQRVVRDLRRKRRWRRWLGRSPEVATEGPTPLHALEGRRAAELTYRILDKLPEAERNALIMFELEGLSGDAIAALTNEPVGTIWVRLHRARTRFRKHFLAEEGRLGRGGTP
jgi:RNA polymerase sigma-70 factor, ECF subfamily